MNLHIALLHDKMLDKQGDLVTTSLTMIDLHDIARSSRTYALKTFYIAHPAPTLRNLARTLKGHWEAGYGSTYNPDRKEALAHAKIMNDLDEIIHDIEVSSGQFPKLIATSAKPGEGRISFKECKKLLESDEHYLLMLGTGWGMSDQLLDRADYFLEPIDGPSDYNHLSVRSAAAIMMDRLAVSN